MIKRKKKKGDALTVFILAIKAAESQRDLAINRIKKLSDKYIQENCNWKIGQKIPIPKDKNPPYEWFTFEKINVKYDETEISKNEREYNVFFVYDGTFTGEGVEPLPGSLKIEPSKSKTNGTEIKESAEVVEP